jgi:hypothetical protein
MHSSNSVTRVTYAHPWDGGLAINTKMSPGTIEEMLQVWRRYRGIDDLLLGERDYLVKAEQYDLPQGELSKEYKPKPPSRIQEFAH